MFVDFHNQTGSPPSHGSTFGHGQHPPIQPHHRWEQPSTFEATQWPVPVVPVVSSQPFPSHSPSTSAPTTPTPPPTTTTPPLSPFISDISASKMDNVDQFDKTKASQGSEQTSSSSSSSVISPMVAATSNNFLPEKPSSAIVDDGDAGVGWSKWTTKVSCSRTCGMGIEIYERRCEYGLGNCNGSTTRYKVCAQQMCPVGSNGQDSAAGGAEQEQQELHQSASYSPLAYSSRHRQCSKFNRQPFDGLFYEWTPYYTSTGQCELFCLAKSANFYHKFADQVEDGTACDPYSESSVCIKGKCHTVGCDGIVGSRLKRDRCGVCGGLNETCNTYDGLVLSGDFTLGYHDVIRLPTGATNVFVHEMAPSINNLALHLDNGEYVLNGDYHIGLSKKVFAGNVLFIYTHNDKQEESLYAEGPLTQPVVVAMLYQSNSILNFSRFFKV